MESFPVFFFFPVTLACVVSEESKRREQSPEGQDSASKGFAGPVAPESGLPPAGLRWLPEVPPAAGRAPLLVEHLAEGLVATWPNLNLNFWFPLVLEAPFSCSLWGRHFPCHRLRGVRVL